VRAEFEIHSVPQHDVLLICGPTQSINLYCQFGIFRVAISLPTGKGRREASFKMSSGGSSKSISTGGYCRLHRCGVELDDLPSNSNEELRPHLRTLGGSGKALS